LPLRAVHAVNGGLCRLFFNMISYFLFLNILLWKVHSRSIFSVQGNWYTDPDEAPFTYFKSSMQVPAVPSLEWQTLFLWPGMQPSVGKNFLPIDNGVLQPVLTWGESCAPNPSHETIDRTKSWWISAQYVNTFGSHKGYTGCDGGNRMTVDPEDILDMIMEKAPDSNKWTQTVINRRNKQSVDFEIDLLNQPQGKAEFVMETPGGWHKSPPKWKVFDIELRSTQPHSGFCRPEYHAEKEPGASIKCSSPIIEGNICTVSECLFNGYTETLPKTTIGAGAAPKKIGGARGTKSKKAKRIASEAATPPGGASSTSEVSGLSWSAIITALALLRLTLLF
jgi:hypothetical protein